MTRIFSSALLRAFAPSRFNSVVTAAFVLMSIAAVAAHAWHQEGHQLAARAALEALPEEVPAFMREAGHAVAHGAVEPDVFKQAAVPELLAVEGPEHYIDMELLEGGLDAGLPPTRWKYIELCVSKNQPPEKVGTLPYAIMEWTERLTVAFAQHRRWPDDPDVRSRCVTYAGVLAHYAGDTHQPLHTTVHFDGRLKPDGTSPRSGIHDRMDALPFTAPPDMQKLSAAVKATAYDFLPGAVLEQIRQSHALVDRVYELEPLLPKRTDSAVADPRVYALCQDRVEASASFVASLIYTAWKNSEKVQLPAWFPPPGSGMLLKGDTETTGEKPAGN